MEDWKGHPRRQEFSSFPSKLEIDQNMLVTVLENLLCLVRNMQEFGVVSSVEEGNPKASSFV